MIILLKIQSHYIRNDLNIIISRKIKTKNDNYKIFENIKIVFAKLNSNIKNAKGQPRKSSDER